MRCDEVQERFIELLYDERGTPSASPELQAHVRSCPACQVELADLRAVQGSLRIWKDEPPLRSVSITAPPPKVVPMRPRFTAMRIARIAAAAAVLVLAFLALANAEVTWNKAGFSFRTHLLSKPGAASDPGNYYTKAEVRDIIRRVADDTEGRMSDLTNVMILRMLDTLEREQQVDMRLINNRAAHLGSRN